MDGNPPARARHVVRLKFQLSAHAQPVCIEAREGFKIIGPLLLRCPESVLVARHVGQRWQLDGQDAARIACAQRVSLRFRDSPEVALAPLGPFDQLNFEDGYCYADQILIAELMITTERWRHCETGLRWKGMEIIPSGGMPSGTVHV
jgi:hypothetical protein